MKAQSVLQLEPREQGHAAVQKAKREGRVPGILYGFDGIATPVEVPLGLLRVALGHGADHHPYPAKLGDQFSQVLIKDVQRDMYTGKPIHVDLMPVAADAVITVSVPIHFHGDDELASLGLQTHIQLHSVTLHGKAGDMPESIDLHIDDMRGGATVTVADLKLPAGLTTVEPMTETVLHVVHSRVHTEEVVEAPRVIIPGAVRLETKPEE